MKKTNFKLFFGLVLVSLAFYNCNKSATVAEKPNAITENSIKPNCIGCMPITVVTNSANIYDSVGLRHNNGCTYVMGVINPSSPTLDSDIVHYTKLYLATIHYDTVQFKTAYNYMVTDNYFSLPDSFYEENPDSLYARLYRNGLISSTEKHYLTLMDSAVITYIGSNLPSQATYDTAAAHIITIETSIIADGTLSTSQKETLLGTASIYRYSYAMWGTYMIDNNIFKWIWRTFGRADAAGAVAGGVAAAFTGVGIFIGAVGGGISASISNLLDPPTK